MTGVTSYIMFLHAGRGGQTGKKESRIHLRKDNEMIEITITETARRNLLKIIEQVSARSIRLIRQGDG